MAYTTINKSTDYFNTKLYTGNATERSITGVGFQPDFTWIKQRTGVFSHVLGNVISGNNKFVSSSNNSAEGTDSGKFKTFESDGFQVGTHNGVNQNSETYASWNWKAGTSQTLNSGNVTSTVNVNTTAGFSIVSWTGTAGNILVSHGLGAVPKMIIVKNLSITQEWAVYHASLGGTKYLELNQNGAAGTASNRWNNSNPDATDFIVSSDASVNGSGNSMIAYCFADVQGYSKFGSYTGNGSNFDNTFVYTGFKPAFIIIKRSDGGGGTAQWLLMDNKRAGYNQFNYRLYPNLDNAEITTDYIDFLSNGFKIREGENDFGASGGSYIYMAFAEAPLVGTNGVTAKAR